MSDLNEERPTKDPTGLDYQMPAQLKAKSWDYEIGALLAVLFWGLVGLVVVVSTVTVGRQRGPNNGRLAANIFFFLVAAAAWPLSRRKGQKSFLRGLLSGTAVLGMIWGIIFLL